jgi:hypothetical protein
MTMKITPMVVVAEGVAMAVPSEGVAEGVDDMTHN